MRKLLLLVSAVVLVDTSFYAAITPLLPDLTEEFGLSKTGAGLLAAAYPVGTFVGGLPGGMAWRRASACSPTVLAGLGADGRLEHRGGVRATRSSCSTSRASSRASAVPRRGRARWPGWPARRRARSAGR